jgi:ubiquinone/menaquinone biosynthesis C-methylase UbiE
VEALIEQAIENNGVPANLIAQGVGQKLPFADTSIDVVYSFAILHHVADPDSIIREMLRVARKAVIIVDGNRFGQGSFPMRMVKLLLYKVGLWGFVNYLKTAGKGYLITHGDGLAYSYSVYDSFDRLAKWADRLIVMPAETGNPKSWFHPLLTSGCILVCAVKGTD